ncbi:MAG: helix-turn-helix domain-containing protein [Jiangellaceae bacterium]
MNPDGGLDVPGVLLQLRRLAELSQRQFVERIGVARSSVAKVETGAVSPRVEQLERMLAIAGLWLAVIDADRREVAAMKVWDDCLDGGGRRFPPYLDLIVEPHSDDWWGSMYRLASPPETYHRSRAYRDARRARSVWETRVKQYRHVPPPPDSKDPRFPSR